MEKQRYQVFRTLVYHYRDGVVTESQKAWDTPGRFPKRAQSATCVTASGISPSGKVCMAPRSVNVIRQ